MARPVPLASFLVLLGYVVASAALLLVNKYGACTFHLVSCITLHHPALLSLRLQRRC